MTPEICTAWLKFLCVAGDLTEWSANPGASNQATVKANGHMALALFVPEVMPVTYDDIPNSGRKGNKGDFYKAATANTSLVFRDLVVEKDGAYKEGVCSGYLYTAFGDMIRVGQKISLVKGTSFEGEIKSQMLGIAKYVMNCQFPNQNNSRIGDGGNNYGYSSIQDVARFFNDPQLLWYVTDEKEGYKTDKPSTIVNSTGMVIMKTDFHNKNSVALISNANNGRTHSHYDDLNIDVYGYGHLLLVDPGTRAYNDTPAGILPMRTDRHNTIGIDDKNQQSDGSPAGISYWASNDLTDFADEYTEADKTFRTKRKILFLKPQGFFIVSDFSEHIAKNNTIKHKYTQTWAPDLYSNFIVENTIDKRLRTNYSNGGNILVVPADPEKLSVVNNLESFSTGLPNTVMQYVKNDATVIADATNTFDTVLYPTRPSENADVKVRRIPLDVTTNVASALKILIDGNNTGYYYVLNSGINALRTFEGYKTDGSCAYVQENDENIKTMVLINGTTLTSVSQNVDLIKANKQVKDFSVSFDGDYLNLSTSQDLSDIVLSIYAKVDYNKILLNGTMVTPTREGDRLIISKGNVQ
jgi:hypothetical protein